MSAAAKMALAENATNLKIEALIGFNGACIKRHS